MNASYDWLRSLVPFAWTPEQVRDALTAHCAPVDALVPLRADLSPIVIARVVHAEPHPDSDHLWLTRVDAGTGTLLDVVCGAPNVQAGRLYPFAPVGTVLPGGLKLDRRKIRGIYSNGMLCSERELLLGGDHAGIMELNVDVAPGTPFLAAVHVGDTRIVVDVTPNRADLLSHIGLARELAAASGLPLAAEAQRGSSSPARLTRASADGTVGGVRVRLEDPRGAPRYVAAVIRGVTVGPSPDWLVARLTAVGSRSINNIVDATNLLLHESGQPMHAFDLAKIAGDTVVVRRAHAGERLTTLDGVARVLAHDMTVIADASRAHAVAGVMGGADSEVTASTTEVFLEVAVFQPARIRSTRTALGLTTDASYRFERGVDPELPAQTVDRAVGLIVDLAGGRADGDPLDLYPDVETPRTIALRVARVERVLGEPVAAADIRRLLASVGFGVTGAGSQSLRVTVPSWRRDVTQEIDLVEEVARLRGYDTFSDVLRPFRLGTVPDAPALAPAERARAVLVAAGCFEARPMPFVAGDARHVRLKNPLAEDEACLRRDVIETLARRAEHNLARHEGNVRIFEIGSVFHPGGALPHEELRAGVLVMGQRRPPHFTEPKPPVFDEWDVRGIAQRLTEAVYADGGIALEPATEPGTLWTITSNARQVGLVRRVALDAPVWAAPAFGIELTLAVWDSATVAAPGSHAYLTAESDGALPVGGSIAVSAGVHAVRTAALPPVGEGTESAAAPTAYRPLPTTPAVQVDLALVLPESLPAATVEAALRRGAGDLLERLELFDEYRGPGVAEGHRSVAWRLTFRHPERTLRDKEIDGRRDKVLRMLETELGVRQRTS
jgi:phenylalanyl-tRNA synthetase beta chain